MSIKSYKRDTDFCIWQKEFYKEEFEQYVQLFKEASEIQKKQWLRKMCLRIMMEIQRNINLNA